VESTQGVYFVPAFSGLGAPERDGGARGVITGLSASTTKAHIVRAMLEGIAYRFFPHFLSKNLDRIILFIIYYNYYYYYWLIFNMLNLLNVVYAI
jgi:hypothetical protein